MKHKIILGLFVITTMSCNRSKSEYATLKTEKTFDFGTISIHDTVNHVFEVKNTSDKKLEISQIGTSCGCTGAIISDSIVSKNESAKIKVQFIPKKDQVGQINNSIVIEANTNPPFTTIYIKGTVKE
ncbi:DUF1573 domain-containing protein [Flavobacterium sp. GT3R68]|uniref:DUF1573 domain-containing protein n=1 Tax=Flavobacterium sp. GT3R68 TaxID=2594437 RepID=UPI000F892519|nr:DUF1573 domain-containing protein [Flavobacterium sp. GT3R68]RTY95898.1 DUF1573 domain-containing protein [Flavobacterium sp. GSN2]TRW93670.1 DUF1573 domain-containing protein [Flavobacterium sp. GT3R68]